jgi:hypothetical protein
MQGLRRRKQRHKFIPNSIVQRRDEERLITIYRGGEFITEKDLSAPHRHDVGIRLYGEYPAGRGYMNLTDYYG